MSTATKKRLFLRDFTAAMVALALIAGVEVGLLALVI